MDKNTQNTKSGFLQYAGCYTAVFFVMILCVFGIFFIEKRSFIWNVDGWLQHFKAMVYYSRYLREVLKTIFTDHSLSIPGYSFSIGYGSDILTTLHYYAIGDPMLLFSVLVPEDRLPYLYTVLILCRYYLAGLFFSRFCFYMGHHKKIPVLAGAITYIFCGYGICYGVRHSFFMNPVMYFPLLLLGVEYILKEKKPGLFIFTVFLSAISNFYFFYMLVFLTVVYAIVRMFFTYGLQVKKLAEQTGVFLLCGVIGVMLAAVVLLPVLVFFYHDRRSEIEISYHMVYNTSYYLGLLKGVLSFQGLTSETYMGGGAVLLCSIFTLFICGRSREERILQVLFLILTVFLLVPIFGSMLNGFSYPANRWIWGFAALIAYNLVAVWDRMKNLSQKEWLLLLLVLLGYLALVCQVWNLSSTKEMKAALLVLCAFVLFLIISRRGMKYWSLITFVFVVASISQNSYYCYAPDGNNLICYFLKYDSIEGMLAGTEAESIRAAADTTDFYRYSGRKITENDSVLSGLSSTQSYWSLSNGYVSDFFKEMATLENISVHRYSALDDRTILNTLAGVRYYCIADVEGEEACVPFGYESVDEADGTGYKIFSNQYALPLGYTYSAFISSETYHSLNSVQKQEAQMQGMVLEEAPEGYYETEPAFSSYECPYVVTCEESVERTEDNTFVVKENNASVTLEFSGGKNCETYVYFNGAEFEYITGNESESADFSNIYVSAVDGSGTEIRKLLKYTTSYHLYYAGRKDFIVNLGYDEAEKQRVTITFSKQGVYTFDSLQIFCQPMDTYVQLVGERNEEVLENVQMNNDNPASAVNEITGTICLQSAKLLLLTIPYSDGWTAYVDGEEQELFRANTMWMGLALDAGEHIIRLEYQTPGLKAGMILSLMGILFLLLLYGIRRNRLSILNKKEHKNETTTKN